MSHFSAHPFALTTNSPKHICAASVMSSASVIRTNAIPRLLHQYTNKSSAKASLSRTVEIWTTTCIVTCFGNRLLEQFPIDDASPKDQIWILVNPCNPGLSGCRKFPYFPRGGPVPENAVSSSFHRDWQPLGYVSQWGGMEVGHGMLYSSSVVDGLVHLHGGTLLQSELEKLRKKNNGSFWWNWFLSLTKDTLDPCPVGASVQTSAGNSTLSKWYNHIIHTPPPFYGYNDHPQHSAESLLASCYNSSLELAFSKRQGDEHATQIAAVPLLGSGCRGFPADVACRVAAKSIVNWFFDKSPTVPWIIDDRTRRKNKTMMSTTHHDFTRPCTYSTPDVYSSNIVSDTTIRRHQTVAFGVREEELAEKLANAIDQRIAFVQGS